jgi:hypothetical protein
MTISFKCPHCNALCAFTSKYAGRRAKCTTCQKRFIIPSKSDGAAIAVKDDAPKPGIPVAGFYRAVFIESWPVIFSPKNLSFFLLIFIVVLARFGLWSVSSSLLKNIYLPVEGDVIAAMGSAIAIATLAMAIICCVLAIALLMGRLWERYTAITYHTAFDVDEFIDPTELGKLFLWDHGWKPFIFVALIFVAAGFPFFIGCMIFDWFDIEYNLLAFKFSSQIILQAILLLCILILPSVFISLVINQDTGGLKPANILPPIYKGAFAYILVAAIFSAALYYDFKLVFSDIYHDNSWERISMNFWPDLALQLGLIFAMRTAGLFYRHYSCYFKV